MIKVGEIYRCIQRNVVASRWISIDDILIILNEFDKKENVRVFNITAGRFQWVAIQFIKNKKMYLVEFERIL